MKRTRTIDDDAPAANDTADDTAEADTTEAADNFPPLERPKTTVHCSMQYGDIVISVIDVTRELALFWVRRHNSRNRKLRPSRRNSYARDMEAGDWMFNGDSIRLDEQGTIIDGQHRLESIVETGITQPMLVVEYLPIDVQMTVDIGAMRSMADQLGFKGWANPTMVAAIARRLCYVKREDAVTYGGAYNPTRAEMRKMAENHKALIEKAVNVALRSHAKRLPVAPSVIGTAYFLAAEKDPYAAELFFVTKLIDTVGLEESEPAQTLQRRYQKVMNDTRQPMDPELAFRYAILAWNKWRSGEIELERLMKPRKGWPPYSEMDIV